MMHGSPGSATGAFGGRGERRKRKATPTTRLYERDAPCRWFAGAVWKTFTRQSPNQQRSPGDTRGRRGEWELPVAPGKTECSPCYFHGTCPHLASGAPHAPFSNLGRAYAGDALKT